MLHFIRRLVRAVAQGLKTQRLEELGVNTNTVTVIDLRDHIL